MDALVRPLPKAAQRAPDRTLRIGLVTETFRPEINGVANTLGHLVDRLGARGHRLDIVRPRQGKDDRANDTVHARELLTTGLPIPGYRGLRFGMPATRQLRARWEAQRPDVLYVATEGPLGRSALSVARELFIPVVSGFHTNFDAYTRFYRVGFVEPLVFRYLRDFHNRCQGTLVPTTELSRELNRKGIKRLGVMARGVDTQLFHPSRRSPQLRADWGLGPDDLAVLYVGRIAAEKNIRLAIDAFQAIKQQRPEARFVLVGDGPLRTRLQQEFPDLVFTGARRGVELAQHYASGDLFLFPSTSETYGNVVIEAMASGLSVLTYDYAAGREHIVDGRNGALAPFDHPIAYVQRALELAGAPDALEVMGHAARHSAEALDWSQIVDRFEHALHCAIDVFSAGRHCPK